MKTKHYFLHLLLFLCVFPFPALANEIVFFEHTAAPPTDLEIRLAHEDRIKLPERKGIQLSGELFTPKSKGKHPAIVLLHDCRGIQTYQREWAQQLSDWGYVALITDSFGPRGVTDLCVQLVDAETEPEFGARAFDAYSSLAYLTTLDQVDGGRIAVMGWAYNAVLASVINAGAHQFFTNKFKAAISFYPDCWFTPTSDFIAPTMILLGSQDDWTPERSCQYMMEIRRDPKHPLRLRVYQGAQHAFDDPQVGELTYLKNARNLYKNPALGATLAYHEKAAATAREDVKNFLREHL